MAHNDNGARMLEARAERELTAHPEIVAAYEGTHGPVQSPYILRELYGEHTADQTLPDIPFRDFDRPILSLLSYGLTHQEITSSSRVPGGLVRTQISDIINRYAPDVQHEHRKRLAAMRRAIALGVVVIGTADDAASSEARRRISLREMAAFNLAERGKSDEEIGTMLGVKPAAARAYIYNVPGKVGARGQTMAVRALREHGVFKARAVPRIPSALFEKAGLLPA